MEQNAENIFTWATIREGVLLVNGGDPKMNECKCVQASTRRLQDVWLIDYFTNFSVSKFYSQAETYQDNLVLHEIILLENEVGYDRSLPKTWGLGFEIFFSFFHFLVFF